MRRYGQSSREPASRACRPARNNNRKFYAPGQCDIKLSVRSNNRTEQSGLNAGQSLATRDNGANGQCGPLTLQENCARRCPVTKRQCNIYTSCAFVASKPSLRHPRTKE
ncbi:unnamed protein product [Arctia plantaginis]|uniref:Uncharacterized protein n=1 Tax=Arctia plantaginis TaxID=874455 RepID=A0A8S1BLD7_ARCPL|nr:unnamed protein product [Arctia plantaginis]CAB3260386.1 unnamed protein product [Arctia plantaginis]